MRKNLLIAFGAALMLFATAVLCSSISHHGRGSVNAAASEAQSGNRDGMYAVASKHRKAQSGNQTRFYSGT